MIKGFLTTFLFCALMVGCSANSNTRPDDTELMACGVTSAEHERLMGLSQRAFDQDFEGGWRTIGYRDGCNGVAGFVIEDYIAAHKVQPFSGNNILFWHAGQAHAIDGNIERAISFFEKAYIPNLTPADEHGYEWGVYAEGTLAFLKQDRLALKKSIATLDALPVDPERIAAALKMQKENPKITFPAGYPQTRLNQLALQGLLDCFDSSYKIAYRKKCPAAQAVQADQ